MEYEVFEYNGEGYDRTMNFGEWRVAFLNYAERFDKIDKLERHMLTDEVFVLLCGSATLYTDTESMKMKPCHVYNIPCGIWHHVVVSEDALVMVAENQNTSKANTEKRAYSSEGAAIC